MIRQHYIIVDLKCEKINLKNKSSIEEIKNLKPYTMNWSNLCDYYHPSDFHRMTLLCSVQDTIHYFYSMNWTQRVRGAFLMDYDNVEFRKGILEAANESYQIQLSLLGMLDILHCPPIDNVFNPADFLLGMKEYKEFAKEFFKYANLKLPEYQIGLVEYSGLNYNIFSRCNSVLSMIYTHDPKVKFEGIDFLKSS